MPRLAISSVSASLPNTAWQRARQASRGHVMRSRTDMKVRASINVQLAYIIMRLIKMSAMRHHRRIK